MLKNDEHGWESVSLREEADEDGELTCTTLAMKNGRKSPRSWTACPQRSGKQSCSPQHQPSFNSERYQDNLAQMRKELNSASGKTLKRKYIEIDRGEDCRNELLSILGHWLLYLHTKQVWQGDKTSNCNGCKKKKKMKRICEEENKNESIFQFHK